MAQVELKLSPSETLYAAVDVRAFITEALNTAPAVEIVQELLVTHVEGKLLHPAVVQESLAGLIEDIVGAATHADWTAITTQLINNAREALLDDEPETIGAR